MTSETRYKFEVYCRDCTGNDSQGCFGGGTSIVETENGIPITSLIRAVELAEKYINDAPWNYDMYEIKDGVEKIVDKDVLDEAYWKYCTS